MIGDRDQDKKGGSDHGGLKKRPIDPPVEPDPRIEDPEAEPELPDDGSSDPSSRREKESK